MKRNDLLLLVLFLLLLLLAFLTAGGKLGRSRHGYGSLGSPPFGLARL